MTARKSPALADRLAELQITPAELAAIIRRPADAVETWVAGDAEPDADALILLRVLDEDRAHAAQLAAERIRARRTQSWRGEAAEHAGIEGVPYGSADSGKTTGGVPS